MGQFVLYFMRFGALLLLSLTLRINTAAAQEATPDPSRKKTKVKTLSRIPEWMANRFEIMAPRSMMGRIAFSAVVGGSRKILALDLDTRRVELLIDGPGDNSYPSWSPSGSAFVFSSTRDGNSALFLADAYGYNPIRLTDPDRISDNPSWSEDGLTVYYYGGNPNTKKLNVFSLNLENNEVRQLTNFSGKNTTPRLSPGGRRLAYSTNRFWPGWDICLFDLISNFEQCPLGGNDSFCRPAFSSNGNLMAYSFGDNFEIDLGLIDLTTETFEQLTDLSGREYDATWSPTEKEMLFTADTGKQDNFDIYLMSLERRRPVPVLKSSYSIRFLSWTPVTTFEIETRKLRKKEFLRLRSLIEENKRKALATPTPSSTPISEAETKAESSQ